MAVPAQRRLEIKEVRHFGSRRYDFPIPDLTQIQTKAYERFLQADVPWNKRKNEGLEALLRETFPIENLDKSLRLEYIRYELGKPRYTPEECKQLRLTYGRPFRVWLRLNKEQPVEEEVFLGEIPIMLGGGEFIINGAERVVVSQLHRSPGMDFIENKEGDRKVYSCRIIPERGSWIEIILTKRDTLAVRIDQSNKFPVMTLLRAMDPKFSQNSDIIRAFYGDVIKEEKIASRASASKIKDKVAVEDIVYPPESPNAGEIIVECGQVITESAAEQICTSGLKSVWVMPNDRNRLILDSLAEDPTASHEEALLRIYQKLRPGNPPQLERARTLFYERFRDPSRYRLGRVARFRINRKLGLNVPEDEMALRAEDLIAAIKYLARLRAGDPTAEPDDIDHLGNRRVRTIDELACEELRKGFLKLRRTVSDRMNFSDVARHDAAESHQSEKRFRGHRVFLWTRRAFSGR
ncbi:MAG: hypothetical protein KatS3mg112_1503 [Thermogutta sp.]|nr:MAG: hypothetical protein KatS3mg112_1503 [Thermogutta sp.]